MPRFTGSVELLAPVADVEPLVEWITAIPFEDWPQQTRLEDSAIRPAMVTDLMWHGFASHALPYIEQVMPQFTGARATNVMLTVVMPGHSIPPHIDQQPPQWLGRVHVPLTTNDESQFIVAGEHHHMAVGCAYLVNTEVLHSVANDGVTPRIHLMFDVMAA